MDLSKSAEGERVRAIIHTGFLSYLVESMINTEGVRTVTSFSIALKEGFFQFFLKTLR